jgi:tetratricopeptide (TPR) repeat protein
LRKFVLRNKGPVLAAAGMLLLLLVAIVGTTTGWLRAVAEGKQKDEAHKTAQRNLQKAHEAVHAYFTRVSEETLLSQPDLEPLRRKLLEDALRFYQGFVEEHRNDPGLRAELAASYFRIGVLSHELGPDEDWLPPFQKCVALVEELLPESADASAFPGLRDGIYRMRAAGSLHVRQPEEALRTLQKACGLWQELARRDPTAPGFRNDLAIFHQVIGFMFEYAGLVAESLRSYEQAVPLWRQLTQEHPQVAHYRAALATSLTGMSQSLTLLGRVAQAEEVCREALAIENQLTADYPEAPGWRDLRSGYTAWQLGSVLEHAGKPAEAEQAYREMLAGLEALTRDYPSVPRYRSGVLRARQWLGELLWSTGRPEEAAEHYRQARALGDQLGPAEAEGRHLLAWSLATCPDPQFRDPPRAVALARGVVEKVPHNGIYWGTLGAALYAVGDLRAAIPALEKATQLPNRDVSNSQFLLAMACWRLGEKEQGRRWYDLAAGRVGMLEVRYAEIVRMGAEAGRMLGIGVRKNQ